jgi:DNA (cytosine-5)-methyltransferase 1
MTKSTFTFIDLFAGIGGFHIALEKLGGKCILASEIDEPARKIYEQNFAMIPEGDIRQLTQANCKMIPDCDCLVGGFPCQPFSVGGKQLGFSDKTRGTLFHEIAKIMKYKKPKLVLLENVKNLAGAKFRDEWKTIIKTFRNLNYAICPEPLIISPNQLPPDLGGRPQQREFF